MAGAVKSAAPRAARNKTLTMSLPDYDVSAKGIRSQAKKKGVAGTPFFGNWNRDSLHAAGGVQETLHFLEHFLFVLWQPFCGLVSHLLQLDELASRHT